MGEVWMEQGGRKRARGEKLDESAFVDLMDGKCRQFGNKRPCVLFLQRFLDCAKIAGLEDGPSISHGPVSSAFT